jgi:acid phosphatase type 7
MHQPPRATALLIAFLSVFPSACTAVTTGDLESRTMGDLSHPRAVRGAFDAAYVAACGDESGETELGRALFRRRPYLQEVDAVSASVFWTSDDVARSFTVRLEEPDGTPVATAVAERDRSAPATPVQSFARFTGLEADHLYCYEMEDADGVVFGRTGFRTAPEPGTAKPVRFAVFGDSGNGSSDQQAVVKQISSFPFDLALVAGDFAYESGTRAEIDAHFFAMYPQLLRSVPFFPITGNHEYETEDAAPFREAFALPRNGGPGGEERWYSFDWGDVHFVALDTEQIGSLQAGWLERDLSRNKRRWTVAYGHRPPYSSGEHGSDSNFRQTFSPILERHGVPLVLTGHDHHYERTKPVHGTTYVVTGGGGNGTYGVARSDFTAFSESVLHFVYVVIDGPRLSMHAIDAVGKEFDSAVIFR